MGRIFELEVMKLVQEHRLLGIEEEWKNELIDTNKEDFLREISSSRPEGHVEKEPVIPEEPEDVGAEDVVAESESLPDGIKKLYREIVKRTHPDKTQGKENRAELDAMYIKSKVAADSHDIYELLVICDSLGIAWSIDISDKEMLKDSLVGKKDRLAQIEKSWIWLWINAPTEDERLTIVRLFIENN